MDWFDVGASQLRVLRLLHAFLEGDHPLLRLASDRWSDRLIPRSGRYSIEVSNNQLHELPQLQIEGPMHLCNDPFEHVCAGGCNCRR